MQTVVSLVPITGFFSPFTAEFFVKKKKKIKIVPCKGQVCAYYNGSYMLSVMQICVYNDAQKHRLGIETVYRSVSCKSKANK